MPTLYIRDVPDEVVESLRAQAVDHGRSLNAEAVRVLSEAARSRRSLDEVLASIRENAASMRKSARTNDAGRLTRAGRTERDQRILGE